MFLQIMDTIKGTMTEIYNDLSKNTSGNTIAEVNSGLQTGANLTRHNNTWQVFFNLCIFCHRFVG